tara:strand:- start:4160 stop:4315 length:156 start_codon:yes stop_codon:yes gene_type:complete
MKIKTKKVSYFGYTQGYKVYINNKKYPIKNGYFYTNMNKKDAIKVALIEAK